VRGGMDPKLTGPNLSEKPLPATQQDWDIQGAVFSAKWFSSCNSIQ
jgi:hypothetical protein